MKKFKNLSKKGFALLIVLVMCLSLLNLTAFAVEEDQDDTSSTTVESGKNGGEESGEDDRVATQTENEDEDANSSEENADSTGDADAEENAGNDNNESSNTEDTGTNEGNNDETSAEPNGDTNSEGDEGNNEPNVDTNSEDDADEDDNDEPEPAIAVNFDEETGTLTITGLDEVTADAVRAYKATAQKVVITNVGTIAQEAFAEFKMQSIEIDHVDYIGYAFRSCTNLKTLVISHVDTIETNAFYNPTSLEEITIDNVKTIGKTVFCPLGGNTKLVTVSLSNIGIISDQAFKDHSKLESLTMVDIGTIGFQTFMNCTGLRSVDLSGVNALGTSAFLGCTGLSELELNGVEIGATAFYGCTGLKEVTLKNIDTIGNQAFTGCTSLKSVAMENIGTIGTQAFSVYGTTLPACTSLKSVTMKNIGTIGTQAFYKCTGLKNLEMEDVDSVGKNAFTGCSGLESVTMDNVTIDENDLLNENKSYSPPFNSAGDTGMTLTVKNSVLGKYAFYNCTGLTIATLENVNTIGQYAFQNCTGLTTVTMDEVDTIDQYAFWYCTGLETVNGLENVKTRIGGFAFYGCENLKNLSVAALTKMGYNGSVEMMERMEAILAGKFKLDSAEKIVELIPDTSGWDGSGIGKSTNWDKYDNGTQLVEQVRWQETTNSVDAEVQVDAYYTAQQQMDYIFVADLSASMAQLGHESDSNARFYDMQSKLLDMTSQLLNTPGYDCQVAIVTFGGYVNDSNPGSAKTMAFTGSVSDAQNYIKALEPLNENTDYALGLNAVLNLLKNGHDSNRNTVVVFLSDGRPTYDGTTKLGTVAALSTYDTKIAGIANQIKNAGVDGIYGVLHSPETANVQYAQNAMNAVCDKYYTSTDTESFGKAMNEAFSSVYTTNTVTIPVSTDFENVRDLTVSASAGNATYNPSNHTITWNVTGMPFTKHTLTYKMTLTEENSQKTGEQSFSVNGGNATFGESGASVDVSAVKLTRTVYTVTYTDGVEGSEIFADQTTKVLAGKATPAFSGAPTREGYTFTGWSPEVADTVTGDVTYTAQWITNSTPANPGTTTPVNPSTNLPNEDPPQTNLPDEDPPLTDLPDEDPPLADLPDEDPPLTDLPDEDPPLADLPDEDPPLTDLPNEDPPLADLPDEDPPLADLPDEDPPLASLPDGKLPLAGTPNVKPSKEEILDEETLLEDIPEADVPLSDVPKTGDNSGVWYAMVLLSACGLAVLTIAKKRGTQED